MKRHSVIIERILLENFLPLYATTGLDKIEINRHDSPNKLIIILGGNGSGKTFLLTEITLDPNESVADRTRGFNKIIPDKNGKKEIDILVDNAFRYRAVIHYPAKTPTKCFIEKENLETHEKVELNPNGNVSSYMDIIDAELGFTSSYLNIGYISDGVTNIIGMSATERNNYISTWLPAISEFLDGFKVVSKNHNILKRNVNMLNNDIAKLTTTDIQFELNNVNASIANLEQESDKVAENLTKAEMYHSLLNDVDRKTLHERISEIQSNGDSLKSRHEAIIGTFNEFKQYSGEKGREKLMQEITKLANDISHWENEIKEIDKLIIDLRVSIQDVQSKNESFKNVENMNLIDVTDMLKTLTTEQSTLRTIRENYTDSFPSYATALADEKDVFQAFHIIDDIKRISSKILEMIDVEEMRTKSFIIKSEAAETRIKIIDTSIEQIKSDIDEVSKRIYILQNNGIDPSIIDRKRNECTPDYCPLLKELLTYISPSKEISDLSSKLNDLISERNNLEMQKQTEFAAISNFKMVLVHIEDVDQMIYRQRDFIGRLPENIVTKFLQPAEFIVSDIDSIEASLKSFQEFISIQENLRNIETRLTSIKQAEQLIMMKDNLDKETQDKLRKYEESVNRRSEIINKLNSDEERLKTLRTLNDNANDIRSNVIEYNSSAIRHEMDRKELANNATHWYYRSHLRDIIFDLRDKKNRIRSELESLKSKKENLQGKIATKDILEKRRDDMMMKIKEYELLENIWSPRIGYPALLIEDFLAEVKEKTNKDLKSMWGDRLQIQDFIISNSEFSIPVIVDRDGRTFSISDASLCSDGEKATLALSISLAIIEIHSQRNVYNVVRLDEADAKLDDNRRRSYLSMVVDRMEEVGVDTCVAVTHNNEFDNVEADVILLPGTEISSTVLSNKNLIFTA